jgi:hypothetical protein
VFFMLDDEREVESAFDRLVEVDDNPVGDVLSGHVSYGLPPFFSLDCRGCGLEFDDDREPRVKKDVESVIAHVSPLVHDGDGLLFGELDVSKLKFDRKSLFVDALLEPLTKFLGDVRADLGKSPELFYSFGGEWDVDPVSGLGCLGGVVLFGYLFNDSWDLLGFNRRLLSEGHDCCDDGLGAFADVVSRLSAVPTLDHCNVVMKLQKKERFFSISGMFVVVYRCCIGGSLTLACRPLVVRRVEDP